VRILLTGPTGQVGWELAPRLASLGQLFALDRTILDLRDADAIRARVRDLRPDIIVNAAAYTAVDRAESEPHLAFAINGAAPGALAEEARALGALLVHYSTDYVFDGTKSGPYVEDDPPNPLSVYGRSKLAGERAIQASGCRHLILRTSWVYAGRGHNFLLSMLRLGAERPELRIVGDQRGAPTWARDIAAATARMLANPPQGLLHLTASGETTRYDFAREIMRQADLSPTLHRIRSKEYPSAALRPANSVLDNTRLREAVGIVMPSWDESLAICLAEITGRVVQGSAR
jgi:dTDP-4-dehydrorhamnose reductase